MQLWREDCAALIQTMLSTEILALLRLQERFGGVNALTTAVFPEMFASY